MSVRYAIAFVLSVVGISAGFQTLAARDTPADPPTQRATVNLTVGSGHEDAVEYDIGQVGGLTLDARGNIYVADLSLDAIRVYSPAGTYAFTIGRKGSGPGDLRLPGNISISKDGNLWVRESANARFSVIRPEPPAGKFIKSVKMNSNSGTMDRVHWDASGHVVSLAMAPSKPGAPSRTVRQFIDGDGTVVATDTTPAVSPDSVDRWVITGAGSVAQYSKPGGMNRLSAFGGAGMAAYATNSVYAVSLVNSKGQRIALIKRSVPLVRYSAREIKKMEEFRDTLASRQHVPASTLPLGIGLGKPAISMMGFDLDGRLWVERAMPEGRPHEADVYAPDGAWIAVMQWPADVQLYFLAVTGSVGLGITVDEDGGQHVVRLAWK